ncbi:FAD-dependent oxidoreductase [Salinispira pacifica]
MRSVDLELLIIGGGVHGTFLSHAMTRQAGIERSAIRVLDPFPDILHFWHAYTGRSGMRFLRSPSSHNMDLDFRDLRRWARTGPGRFPSDFIEPYTRPSLPLFNRHVETVIQDNRLEELRLRGRAKEIRPEPGFLRVAFDADGSSESITSRRVLLAIGRSEQLSLPPWASELRRRGAPVRHIFDLEAALLDPAGTRGSIVVFGGGITSAQFALALHRRTGREVVIVARHPVRVRMFDSNPCFIGPKCLADFRSLSDYGRRRREIRENRNPGSLPPYVAKELADAIDSGGVRRIVAETSGVELSDGCVRFALDVAGGERVVLEAEQVYLATGFRTERPGGSVVTDLISRWGLPAAACGYPIVDRTLHWGRGIYAAGTLAELELGPSCLNIIGAHNAAKILTPALKD